MSISRFERGRACYTCIGCGKKTRAVGDEASTVSDGKGFCAACYAAGLIENEHFDGYHDEQAREDCLHCKKA